MRETVAEVFGFVLGHGTKRWLDDPKARMKLEPLLDQERERISHTFPGPGGYTF